MSREALKLALEALEYIEHNYMSLPAPAEKAITALREALTEQPAQQKPVAHCEAGPEFCPVCHAETRSLALAAAIGYIQRNTPPLVSNEICNALKKSPPAQQQEPVRLRRGNILRCIETDELCTVWSTSTTGRTLVKWKENEFGAYTAEQIGELFWLEPEPDDLELAAEKSDNYAAFHAGYRFAVAHSSAEQPAQQEPVATNKVYVTREQLAEIYPPASKPWVGLTDEEVKHQWEVWRASIPRYAGFATGIEAKLREKNNG